MTLSRVVSVVLLLVGGAVERSHAACTTIPERPLFIRGTRGSIDRPFLSPDLDEVVTLRPPPSAEGYPVRPLATSDVLITAVFKSPDAAPTAFFVAGNNDCEPLEQPTCFIERLFCHAARSCVTGAAVGLSALPQDGMQVLRFRFPQTRAAGPVTLAVTSASQPPPLELQTQTCDALEKSGHREDLSVCIDTFNPADIDPPGVEPPAPKLIALPASNDYQSVCTKDVGDTPHCSGKAADIRYTVDAEGNVLVPMNWNNILRPGQGGGLARRELRGSSAVEAVLGQGKRVYIPSAVFLETVSQQGGGFSPSPVFVPQELPDRPNEQTLFGTADKGKSVLKIWRRKLWNHVCDSGVNQSQACEPVSASEDCPGAQCVPGASAYFACVGGSRNALPCTRPQHCPNGACQNISVSGSICYSSGVASGVPCKLDSDCGANAQCGAGLFEYENRLVNGVGKLHRKASSSAPGVCDSGSSAGLTCTGSLTCNPFILGPAGCVTYRADALTYSQPGP